MMNKRAMSIAAIQLTVFPVSCTVYCSDGTVRPEIASEKITICKYC